MECRDLQDKILKKYERCFKEKLSPSDRVNIKPVKLEINTSVQIRPHLINTPFHIPYYMREPSDKEFKSMLDAGII